MNIYIYSDESGVFDKFHNEIFVFGGLVFLSKEERDISSRRYSSVEKVVAVSEKIPKGVELKATRISNKGKGKLFRSLNKCYKFGVVIKQKQLLDRIFDCKKSKQRFLDYAYKIGIKRFFQHLISKKIIDPNKVERLYFFVDEHTTATNGYYELRESLEQEFKYGTFRYDYGMHYPPIFKNLKEVQLQFCNSSSKILIRSADIVANKIYYLAIAKNLYTSIEDKLYISKLP